MKNKSKIDLSGTVYPENYNEIHIIEKELNDNVPNIRTNCYKDAVGFRLVTENYNDYEWLIETFKRLFVKFEINSIGFETNGKNKVAFFK